MIQGVTKGCDGLIGQTLHDKMLKIILSIIVHQLSNSESETLPVVSKTLIDFTGQCVKMASNITLFQNVLVFGRL